MGKGKGMKMVLRKVKEDEREGGKELGMKNGRGIKMGKRK